jgi:hypothetical protein
MREMRVDPANAVPHSERCTGGAARHAPLALASPDWQRRIARTEARQSEKVA